MYGLKQKKGINNKIHRQIDKWETTGETQKDIDDKWKNSILLRWILPLLLILSPLNSVIAIILNLTGVVTVASMLIMLFTSIMVTSTVVFLGMINTGATWKKATAAVLALCVWAGSAGYLATIWLARLAGK